MKMRKQLLLVLGLVLMAGIVPAAADEGVDSASPWLGVYLVDEVDGGIRIVAVVPGGPAAIAGLRSGDLLLGAGSVEIADQDALARVLDTRGVDKPMAFQVLRDGESMSVKVTPVERWTLAREPVAPTPSRELFGRWRGLSGGLGLEVVAITPELRRHYGADEDRGVLVVRAEEDSLAARAGVEVGDVVIGIAGATVTRPGELELSVVRWGRREPLRLELVRGGKAVQVELAIPEPPPAPGVPMSPFPASDPELRRRRLEASIERMEKQIQEMRRQLAELKAKEASQDR